MQELSLLPTHHFWKKTRINSRGCMQGERGEEKKESNTKQDKGVK